MSIVDLLSDTTYRQQAVNQLHNLLRNTSKFPVESSQIYGLRQIARQQPDKVSEFAGHQGERAEKLGKQNEVDFWTLVVNLCSDSVSGWSVPTHGHDYLPEELGDQYLRKVPGTTPQETQKNQEHNNKLRRNRREWFRDWNNEHIPAFFERFCTECLYRKAMIETLQVNRENDPSAHQDQNEPQNNDMMRRAFTDARQRQ